MKTTNTWKIDNVNPVKPNTDRTVVPVPNSNASPAKSMHPTNSQIVPPPPAPKENKQMEMCVEIVLMVVRLVVIVLLVRNVLMGILRLGLKLALLVLLLALLVREVEVLV